MKKLCFSHLPKMIDRAYMPANQQYYKISYIKTENYNPLKIAMSLNYETNVPLPTLYY